MYKWSFTTPFNSGLEYELYLEKHYTLAAEDIIQFYGLDESVFEECHSEDKLN